MRQTTRDIILRAKQQPRLGMADLGDSVNAFNEGLKSLSKDANVNIAGIGALATQLRGLADSYAELANKTKWLEDQTVGLQKTFGLNTENATAFYETLVGLSKEYGVGATKLANLTISMKSLIGGYANMTKGATAAQKSLLTVYNAFQTNLGLSADQAKKFTMYASMQGKTADEALIQQNAIAKSITEQTGYQLSLTDLLTDMSSLTEDVQLQYGKIPGQLELAVTKAKMLGFSMADLNKTGQQLLNIQSSVGDELEYQLLSGHRLVDQQGKSLTNMYREATLRGDANAQVDIMNKMVSQEASTLKNNLFARQQMAKLLGTDEATIARTLAKQELLSKIGAESLMGLESDKMKQAIEETEEFKQMSDDDKKKYLDDLMKLNDTRTTEQRMADGIEQMVSEIIKLSSNGNLSTLAADRQTGIMSGLTAGTDVLEGYAGPTTAEVVGMGIVGGQALEKLAGPLKILADPTQWGKAITDALKGTLTINPIKADKVILNVSAEEHEDAVIAPGSDKVLFSGGKASLFGQDDYVTASTNNPMSGGGGGGGWAQVVAAIEAQTRALNNTGQAAINPPYWT